MKGELADREKRGGDKRDVLFPHVYAFAFAVTFLGCLSRSSSSVKFILILSASVSSILFSAIALLTSLDRELPAPFLLLPCVYLS